MEGSLREMRYKEVISIADGSRYGFVGDMEIDLETGRVKSLIIPGQARFFGLFGRREDTVIAWDDVRRFGEDIILVEGVAARRPPERERRKWWGRG